MPAFIKKFFLCVPQRFVVCALCSGAVAVCTMHRHTFVSNILNQKHSGNYNGSTCPPMGEWYADDDPAHTINLYWEVEVVQAVSRSFNIGFLAGLVPSGMLADACGAKTIIWLGLLTSSLTTLVSPASAQISPLNFITVRFFQGIGQAMVFPSVGSLMVQWVPLTERATSSAVICVGEYVGYVLGYSISRWNEFETSNSWKMSFYVAAAIGILYIVVWLALVFDRPATSTCISPKEQDLIYGSTKMARVHFYRRPFFPLTCMLRSGPVLSLLSICCASSWIQLFLLNHFHDYLEHIPRITHGLTASITMGALTAVVPSTLFWCVVSDCLVNRRYISRTKIRKTLGLLSNMLLLPCVLAIPWVRCDWMAAGWFFTAAVYFRGIFFSLGLTNALDLTPHHAGALLSLINITESIASVFSWEFLFTIIKDIDDIDQWWIVFAGCSLLLVVLSIPYLFYCSAEVQPWDSRLHSSFLLRSDVLFSFFMNKRADVREPPPDSSIRPSSTSQSAASNITSVKSSI